MILRPLLTLLTLLFGLWSASAMAACTFSNQSVSFGSYSSFTIASTPETVQANSGITCKSEGFSILQTSTVNGVIGTANPSGATPRLSNGAGYYIPYQICSDSSCNASYGQGSSIKWSSVSLLGLLTLFNGPNGSLPLYLRTVATNVPAGTYTDTITVNWNYHICFLLTCPNPDGTGTSIVTLTLIVTPFCYLDSAPNVTFSAASIISSFSSVTTPMGVRCTLNSSYNVNMASANPLSGSWRQMQAISSGTTNYLQYQFYKPDGTSWTPSSNYTGTGTGGAQTINYVTTINPAQPNKPVGNYSDVVTVTVSY